MTKVFMKSWLVYSSSAKQCLLSVNFKQFLMQMEQNSKHNNANCNPRRRRFAVYDICRLQTTGWRPQTADCRLQTADCMRQHDCKLNDTKNPPNKGDVFKNRKSCEISLGNKVDIFVQSYLGLIPKMLLAILHRLFIISPGISLITLILYSSLIIVNW